jgi:hypothetical protein
MILAIYPCYKVCLDFGIIVQLEILMCYDYKWGVGIATGYGLDGLGWIPGSARFFYSPRRSDRLRGPPSLLSKGYRGLFP